MARQRKQVKPAPIPAAPSRLIVKSWPDVSLALLLLVGVAMVYGQVAGHEFLNYDDPQYVTANPQVRNGLTSSGIV